MEDSCEQLERAVTVNEGDLDPARDAASITGAEAGPVPLRSHAPLNLDALSVLAGGVAHHFNNLLCVILGYAEMLMDELQQREDWATQAREIYHAADKAATLAHQLLAFSRKQRATLETVDPNRMLRGLEALLRPMVTEEVALELDLEDDVPAVRVNRMQLELCVLNLVLNAKEAMPRGGVLTLRTSTVVGPDFPGNGAPALAPGSYARISVTDTGMGIAPEICARLFEPFFTTKDVGQGTGLGLAMVHGIVRQAGGDVRVSTMPGEGATFSILLPATRAEAQAGVEIKQTQLCGGNELVLLVEDEERVRRLVRKTLSRQGYRVIAAGDAAEAREILRDQGEGIQLLVTDVVLPGTNGLDLARAARQRLPALRVLLISGYAAAELARYGPIEPDLTLLQKPFRPPELVLAVRRILDRMPPAEQSVAA